MDALPPPPAVVQLQEKCTENTQSMCHKSEAGYSVFIRTWQEDAHQLMERLNQVPLQSLQLAATAVSDRDLRELKNTQTLTSLRLWCMPINGSGLDSLPTCENVERLYIEKCMLNGKQLAGFRKFPNVRQLKLEVWSHSDEAIRCVAPMSRLETFSIVAHGAFSGDGLIGLKDKKCLEPVSKLHLM